MKQPSNSEEKTGSCDPISEAEIDEALEESFPASDPLPWTSGSNHIAGTTKRKTKKPVRAKRSQTERRLEDRRLGLVTLPTDQNAAAGHGCGLP
jgi:hypothetical protein